MDFRHKARPLLLAGYIACVFGLSPAVAEVAVFSNRTGGALTVSILADSMVPQPFSLEAGESRPVFYDRALSVRFGDGLVERTQQVAAKCAYFFTRGASGDEELRLEQIGFAHNKPAPSEPRLSAAQPPVVSVKILVDDNEPTPRRIWEPNLRRRFAAAAEIIERHSGVKLTLNVIGTWDSDDRVRDFSSSLAEFEREVTPRPAQLAIGFTSQYDAQQGRIHMGGTRGALYPYILLKERSPNMLETQRVELLVHELGHFLGASHSPEPQSVMRPLLTSSIQRRAGARIGFDPVNTLLMAMLGDEIRTRGIKHLSQVSEPTRMRMEEIYAVLAKALPKDPAAAQYLQMLGMGGPQPVALASQPESQQSAPQAAANTPQVAISDTLLADSMRMVVQLTQVVRSKRPTPTASSLQPVASPWYTGDKLTEFYVRQAALVAIQLDPQEKEKVFLIALGAFLDDSRLLSRFPATAAYLSRLETEGQRAVRLDLVGTPTMRDRHDLALHFFLSAHLATALSPQVALGLGIAKEMKDANDGSGFSFADLAADRAGIEFARRVAAGDVSLEDLSNGFSVDDYLPPVDGLPEGLTLEEFNSRYGAVSDQRFQDAVAAIETAVANLPAHSR